MVLHEKFAKNIRIDDSSSPAGDGTIDSSRNVCFVKERRLSLDNDFGSETGI
jgi:hypothetical protein